MISYVEVIHAQWLDVLMCGTKTWSCQLVALSVRRHGMFGCTSVELPLLTVSTLPPLSVAGA